MIAIFGLAIGILAKYSSDYVDSNGDIVNTDVNYNDYKPKVMGIAGLWLGLLCFCFALTIIEIILLFMHRLKPMAFIIMNSLKSGIWVSIFVFDVIAVVQNANTVGQSNVRSSVGLVIEAGLLLCFLIPLIYGAVVFHRSRKAAGAYKPVGHPYSNPAGDFGGPTAYPPQYKALVLESDIEANRIPGARRLSYNHQKDTRFESYRRASNSYGDASPLEKTIISGSPDVPNIHVQNHDGEAFEMGSRRGLR